MTQHSQNGEGVEARAREVLIRMICEESPTLLPRGVRHCVERDMTALAFSPARVVRAMIAFADEASQSLAREPATADVEREAVRAVTAEMRRFMPNACGDWADKIDAAMLKEKARKVAFYDEPGHDIRPGETLPDRDRRIYQQGRHDALNDEPEAFI